MTKIVNTWKSRFEQRGRFRRTLSELNLLSDREAADLGLSRADFRAVAHRSVYGY
ncbi:DUF1127 domain-containing protein [Mangrovicoccus algicola]|uniref:DUF1127 domain-containing protein n=1 Tax=Mangrovicoccus algicola TaxID=2771008 RepID=A0A8J6YXC2_9RHOB|nr:DUF1127 domain-containing protein [Mangrovicoccus algicola]MBE3637658.1 DUF1127 domain-containing protein [Mangrovicoccus algicola]